MTDHILKLEQQPNKFAPKTKPHGSSPKWQSKEMKSHGSRNWSFSSKPKKKYWHPKLNGCEAYGYFKEEKHHESPNRQHALSYRPSAAPYL